jgi:hypothetical protein
MHAEGHTAEQPPEWPASTDKLQGPFRLKGGGTGWVLPLPPGFQTPAVKATPTSQQGSIDPPLSSASADP